MSSRFPRSSLWLAFLVLAATAAAQETGLWGEVELVEEARIGVLDGPEEYVFGRIGAVAMAPDGSIFVADNQLKVVRQYSSSGGFLRNVGREGEGPGEYQYVLGMQTLPDGGLVVLNAPNQVILYDPDGSYGGEFRAPGTLLGSRMLEVDQRGSIYVKRPTKALRPGARNLDFLLLEFTSEGTVVDTIPLPREESEGHAFFLVTSEGALRNFVIANASAWNPRGFIVTGWNDRYSLRVLEPGGKVIARLERPVERVETTAGEREEWEAWAGFLSARSSGIPRQKPCFRDISCGSDGRIWVHRYVEAVKRDMPPRSPGDDRPLLTWREPPTFDVFEADATFLGTVVLPPETAPHAMHGLVVWAVQKTDEGEQVVRFRISPERSSN